MVFENLESGGSTMNEVKNHISEQEWQFLLKLRRFIASEQKSVSPSEPASSPQEIIEMLIKGWFL